MVSVCFAEFEGLKRAFLQVDGPLIMSFRIG